jgi:putative peptidoglycan lipid II flippase
VSIGRTTLLLAPIALVARTVAFFVPVVVARVYGVQPETDAFFWALSVPTFLLVLASMAVATVLVPPLARLRAQSSGRAADGCKGPQRQRQPDEVPRFLGAAVTYAGLGTLAFGVAFALAAPMILRHATTFDAPTRALAGRACWELLPLLVAVALASVLRTACEVYGRFRVTVGAPLLRAIIVIGLLLAGHDHDVSRWLTVAFSAGMVAEMTLLAATLARAGVHIAPTLRAPSELRDAARAVAPVLTGEAMVALNLVVDKAFAANLGSGAVSLLEYADRAQMIPRTVLESTLITVAFNAWARTRAAGDVTEQRRAVTRALLWLLLLAPPVLAGMSIGRVALIELLYGGGAFSEENVARTASALDAFLPGVLFSLLGALVVKAHILDGRIRLVLGLGVLSFTMNATLDAILVRAWDLPGLATATSLTTVTVTVISLAFLAPSLRGTIPLRVAAGAVALATAAALLAIGARVSGFAPVTVSDPALWFASIPCFALLVAGALRARTLP